LLRINSWEELTDLFNACPNQKHRVMFRLMYFSGLRHTLNPAVKKADIRKDVNMHVLRYCFASLSIEHGMNSKTLQYLMEHGSVHYAK
jgi:integrase